MSKVAYISTYVPQKCGLATYTYHLRQAVHAAKRWRERDPVVVLRGVPEADADDPLLWPLPRDVESEYVRMAHRLNRSDVDAVSLQHEFGIFGGEAGRHLLGLVRRLEKPLVTTFHTVFEHPQEPYASIQREIAERSDRIVVMNRMAVGFLRRSFGIPEEKIRFLPHGTPEPDAGRRDQYRQQLGWSDRKVLMTFGLLGRGKGIELMLKALPEIVRRVPNALYVIAGQTHPEVKKREGERYREELRAMIRGSGLERNVAMIDRYMEERDLVRHITACDVYVTPYPGLEQITSGTLAYAVGLGRPVLSTPYRYAQDLLAEQPQLLIPYEAEAEWAERAASMLADDGLLRSCERDIARIGRTMHWLNVGRRFERLLSEVAGRVPAARTV